MKLEIWNLIEEICILTKNTHLSKKRSDFIKLHLNEIKNKLKESHAKKDRL